MIVRSWFPLGVAIGMVAFLVVFRVAIGAGFGLGAREDQPDLLPTGFVGDLRDNYTYASWAQQARAGAWLFHDAHTTDPHRAVYFNPYYLLVGLAARAFGIQPFFIMNVLGLIGAGVTVLTAYLIARAANLGEAAARWACVLVAFGMGLSVPAAAVYKLLGIDPMADTQRLGADVWYHDAFGFNCFMTLPYQSLGWALMALVVLATVAALGAASDAGRFRRRLALLAPATMALASVRPYEPVILLSSFGLFALASLLRQEARKQWRSILLVGIVLGVSAVPFVAYQVWVSRQPVWRDFAALAAVSYRSRLSWLIGYGMLLPLAAHGAVLVWRDARFIALRWFTAWLALLVLLLIVIEVRQTKFSSAGTIPMCALAAHALVHLIRRIRAIEAAPQRRLAAACLAAAAGSCFVTAPAFAFMLGRHFDYARAAYPSPLHDAARRAISLSPAGSTPGILCDAETGNVLAGIAPVGVFIGHGALTPDFDARHKRLIACGFYGPKAQTDGGAAFDALLRDAGTAFVIVGPEAAAFEYATGNPSLRLVDRFGRFGEFVLFQQAN